jgi:hypothetical protein
MKVGLPGNVAIPIGQIGRIVLRNTRKNMGEIVDLERYRKIRRRREAEAKKVKRADAPDSGKAGSPSPPPVAKRAEPGNSGTNGGAKTRGDDPKSD